MTLVIAGRWDWANLYWDQANFRLMGKYGDEVDFSTLPTRVQTKQMAQEFGVQEVEHQLTFEACGSRGEVQNDPSRGHAYLFGTYTTGKEQGLDRTYHYWHDGPSNLWENVVLRAPDQLRHRVAWALNQFIALSPQHHWAAEPAAVFYDILVNHAFGNFRDIIKEIAQNRMMAWYLTFEGNKKHKDGVYPDENFSREIMQLFTIGLYELNMDGTHKMNPETGDAIPTYDNNNIVSFARIWTGWGTQEKRSNIQRDSSGANSVDPLKLTSADRDTFPKTSLDGGESLSVCLCHCVCLPVCCCLPVCLSVIYVSIFVRLSVCLFSLWLFCSQAILAMGSRCAKNNQPVHSS